MPLVLIHDPGEPDAAWFSGLEVPGTNGASCCNMSDCKPANERETTGNAPSNGREVYISKAVFGPEAPDDWVRVPESAILKGHDNPTGRAVVCFFRGNILCYVPGPGL